MKFTILSHACLYVEAGSTALLVDPWLRGSAYWRSWWNYPPADPQLVQSLRPTHIFLTHIHWDHFHGPSLRPYGKQIPLLIPEDRYDRMARDLRSMGFKNITAVPHGKEVALGPELSIRPYLFLPMTDTALMIYSPRVTLLDANDCKICGLPLAQLTRDFPRIDFAFRSHSSANNRICHQHLDQEQVAVDAKDSYLRSFCNFMRAVRPKYAVPFASNHCHLHRDTLQFNDFIQTPLDVANYFETVRSSEQLPTELKIMLPGSSWSEENGFSLMDTGPFSDRQTQLRNYAADNEAKLQEYYALEAKVAVSTEDMRAFFVPFLESIPWFVRRKFRDRPMVVVSEGGRAPAQWRIDLYRKTLTSIDAAESATAPARIHFPAIVLRQCLRMNMFGHAGISKRPRYLATTQLMPHLLRFEMLLNAYELEFLPLRRNLTLATLKSGLRRWRELFVYAEVVVRMALGQKAQEIEQRLLVNAAARSRPVSTAAAASDG
jgi:UDP-MurNAc hydroxylase